MVFNERWKHPKNNINLEDFKQALIFLRKSLEPRFFGVRWKTQARNFAGELEITEQRVRTLIRIMVNIGIFKDENRFPLILTEAGKILKIANDILSTPNISSILKNRAERLYNLIISSQLSLFHLSISNSGFQASPNNGFNPLKEILRILAQNNSVSKSDFIALIRDNLLFTYWKDWFEQTGMITYNSSSEVFTLSGNFNNLKEAIIQTNSYPDRTENQWVEIRANPLSNEHLFKNEIKSILSDLILDIKVCEDQFGGDIKQNIDTLSQQLTINIRLSDIKTEDEFFDELKAEEEREIQYTRTESEENRTRVFDEKNRLARRGELPPLKKNLMEQLQTDQALSAKLKEEHHHTCQACGESTFETRGGYNYTETHHVLPMSKGGEDAPFNMAILCPTCHRKIHYGIEPVQAEVYRNLQVNGINIDFERLLEIGVISQEILNLINR